MKLCFDLCLRPDCFDIFLWHFMSSMLMVGIPCHFHICHLLSFGTNNLFADLPARHTDFDMLCTVIEWCWTFPTVWHMFCVHCISRVACASHFRHLVGCYTHIYVIPFLFQPWYDVQNVLCLILTIAVNIRKKQIIHLFIYIMMISRMKMGVEQFLNCHVM